jgi:hypothetical protein
LNRVCPDPSLGVTELSAVSKPLCPGRPLSGSAPVNGWVRLVWLSSQPIVPFTSPPVLP